MVFTQVFVRVRSHLQEMNQIHRERPERGAQVLEGLLWMSLVVAAIAVVGPIVINNLTGAAEQLPDTYDGVVGG